MAQLGSSDAACLAVVTWSFAHVFAEESAEVGAGGDADGMGYVFEFSICGDE
jgi:hypothetical protein